ncbi:MAG: D-aminoacylase [Maribacter sp.]
MKLFKANKRVYFKKIYKCCWDLVFILSLVLFVTSCNFWKSEAAIERENEKREYDMIITNGTLADGTGKPLFRSDLGIKDGSITALGRLDTTLANTIIDAKGQIVAPGFIDVHTHIEESIQRIPTADNYLQGGVTSIITGNCGGSETDLKAFFHELDSIGISINVGSLIGHNSVRTAVMGEEDRDPTEKELKEMQALVENAMRQGAMGLSTGLAYVPGTYSKTAEVAALTKVSAAHNGIYATHMRDEGLEIIPAIEEAIAIADTSNSKLQISHFKILAKPLWGRTEQTLQLVENARKRGLDVAVDQYPYTASSTTLSFMVPTWALEGGDDAIRKRLSDVSNRPKIVQDMMLWLKEYQRENYDFAVVSIFEGDKSYLGKNIHELNLDLGRENTAESEAHLILDMVAKYGRQGCYMVYHRMAEEDIERILAYPYTAIAGDARVENLGESAVHPRAYGTNARILKRYVREKGMLSLEEAVHRMTGLPAQRFRLQNRGSLEIGQVADIVIFDKDKISDEATFEESHAFSSGISHVMVNGELTIANGKHTQVKNGAILKPASNKEL